MAEIVACTEEHTLPDGRVELLGASRSVTGAMTRVVLQRTAFLVDCGIAQGRDAATWRMPDAARETDAVLLTHGHNDHIGSLPALIEGGWQGPIVATRATLDVARISLEDSLEMKRIPHREVNDFLRAFDRMKVAAPYDHTGSPLDAFGGTIAFRDAGHILGSASVELRAGASRLIVSGDLGRPHSPLLRDPNTHWSSDRPVDLVVIECTYGSRDHMHDHTSIEATLERVLTATFARGGKVFIPAFAIGRTQTLVWFLDRLMSANRVPRVPVFVDTPMGLSITDLYQRNRTLYDRESLTQLAVGDDPLNFEQLFAVKKGAHSARVRETPGPAVVIAGSGMCVGGRIVQHLIEGLPDARNTVLFVGHQAAGTTGQRIQTSRGGTVRLEHDDVEVRAEIETLRGLSAHADRRELVAWLGHVPGLRRVALHHGDEEAQHAFAAWAPEALTAFDAERERMLNEGRAQGA
jgi:metallo-beta-lactamase family protein